MIDTPTTVLVRVATPDPGPKIEAVGTATVEVITSKPMAGTTWMGPATTWPIGMPANQTYSLTLDATGGSFVLVCDTGLGATASIAWDATLATVRSTIQAAWGADVLVTGEDLPDGPIVIEFTGSLAAKRYVVTLE